MFFKMMTTLMISFILLSCNVVSEDKVELKTKMDSVSYALGLQIGTNFKNDEFKFETNIIKKGLGDGFTGEKPILTETEIMNLMVWFQTEMNRIKTKEMADKASKNKGVGVKFLADNKAEEGVTETASGLQYIVMKQGDGPMPTLSDKVKVHYHGSLIDGTVFDSSVDRGQPIEFNLGGVIKGWQEGLQLMKKGSKFKLFIPPDIGYGERGSPPKIGPNAVLVFEVELLDITSPEPAKQAAPPVKK